MKKTIMFVAAIAFVAFAAVSCKKKGDAPKAGFEYANELLAVQFTNTSTGATEYVWNFGDGSETSTEKDPLHVYAENGTYTVTLTAKNEYGEAQVSDEIVLDIPAIVIDGEFADWDAVIADKAVSKAAVTELQNGVEYDGTSLKKFAAYLDADFIYFMLVCDADEEAVMPLDVFFGVQGELEDESPCTSDWEPMYCDYLCEFGKGDTFDPDNMDWYDWSYDTFFAFDHVAGGWTFNQLAQNVCDLSDKVKIDGGLMQVEGKIALANFTLMSKSYVYICAMTSNSGWGGSGFAPAAEIVEGTTIPSAQLKVEFSDYGK